MLNIKRLPPPPHESKSVTTEFLRFYFTCVICVVHCNAVAPFIVRGYIAVEFFFVLSGYFLYHSFQRHPDVGVLDFTLRKAKRFFIPFALSMLLLMALDRKQYLIPSEWTPDGVIGTYVSHLHEFFFLWGLRLTRSWPVNGPMWYLSILLIGGALLYALLRSNRSKATTLWLPAICIFGFAYIYDTDSALIPGISKSLVRGLAEMALGILTAVFIERKQQAIARRARLFDLMGIFAFLVFTLMTLAKGNHDYLSVVLAPMMLTAVMTPSCHVARLFRSRLWMRLGGLSLYMYIIHQFVAAAYFILAGKIEPISQLPVSVSLPCYLIVVIMSAMILRWLSKLICHRFEY